VLQQGAIEFEPYLVEKDSALEKIVMGNVQRIVFVFKQSFWEDLSIGDMNLAELEFLHTGAAPFRTWWTALPLRAPIIVAWNSGRNVLEESDPDKLALIALEKLARTLDIPLPQIQEKLVTYRMHDWRSDPLSLGAYSYIKVGGIDGPSQLALPVQNTLFFAGEATNDAGHIGTVHGALATGIRAANQVMESRT
jgi:monoamine oxidase